jgi:hypothetical protein
MRFVLSVALMASSLSAVVAQADATLVYTLADAETVTKKIAIARYFARVESSDRPDEYLLYQAGKFFPLYRVNPAERTYTLLTKPVKPTRKTGRIADAATSNKNRGDGSAGSAAQDQTDQTAVAAAEPPSKTVVDRKGVPGTPQFKPTRKMDKVGGVKCRIVMEFADGETAIEHCMANKAGLGITERESRTLARLLVMAREQGYGWLGAATEDEDFVSVRCKIPDQPKSLELVSVSTQPLPRGHLRVPPEYKEVPLAATSESTSEPKAGAESDATKPEKRTPD